ncbi:hypothetical protein [uncultured Lacticaseibacillus sp.]|uniref:hypothetical protein n=1 Tax=uncultured Lacticaseibacillus sp. TaxID=2775882 RepID=UPI002598DD61|nr:hypothetical protein [uncultured Lacticaseibacillus sp.]
MWFVLLGIVLIGLGVWQVWRTRKYMHFLRTDAGPDTSPFALNAVYTSVVIGVLGVLAGVGVIVMGLTGQL